jgi:hypothetical protein
MNGRFAPVPDITFERYLSDLDRAASIRIGLFQDFNGAQSKFGINICVPNSPPKVNSMKSPVLLSIFAAAFAIGSAVAQTAYAGMQTRSIKALSEQQIADLRTGRGVGLALAAELNGYPGPSHLLELADKIGLSDAQRNSARSMFEVKKAETIPIGERLIAQEAALDKLFVDHAITPEKLNAATAEIGVTQAKLRAAHLKYHLSTVAMLEPSQIRQYSALRGYDNGGSQEHHHHQ